MVDELTVAILNLNIRYYQMRIAEDTVRQYDNKHRVIDQEIRDILIKGLREDEKLYYEQNKLVEDLINNIKKK